MIKRLIVIVVLVYIFFIVELVLNDVLGRWAKPQLLLLLVVFWGLYSGIRYSIVTAFLAGLLKDSYSILPFGTYLFIFVASAYLTTFVRRNLYQPGSRFSRAVVAFCVVLGAFVVQSMLYVMDHEVRWWELLLDIFLPSVILTMFLVTYVFGRLRDVAVWLKI